MQSHTIINKFGKRTTAITSISTQTNDEGCESVGVCLSLSLCVRIMWKRTTRQGNKIFVKAFIFCHGLVVFFCFYANCIYFIHVVAVFVNHSSLWHYFILFLFICFFFILLFCFALCVLEWMCGLCFDFHLELNYKWNGIIVIAT